MRRRQGFTLVELMVAMALIVLIMAIVSQAFVDGLETFRQLKGIGDLQERLRAAVVPLRQDLCVNRHFQRPDLRLNVLSPNNPPSAGFFRIQQGAVVQEGNDPDGLPSSRAT